MTEDTGTKIVRVDTPEKRMNREQRRKMKKNAPNRLKTAKSFVLVTFNNDNRLPNYSFDVGALKDKEDIRHAFMRECAQFVQMRHGMMQEAIEKVTAEFKQADKVEAEKARLSGRTPGEAVEAPAEEKEGVPA